MRDTFVKTLLELAKVNKNIEIVTGDLGFGVLKPFWEQLPNQFTNVGIAEQNMTSIAAGMAMEGKTVFTYSIGNFSTLRCLEQIRNDCAYHNADVKIVCVGGGFAYGSLGMSHQATEDIAVMRALPDVMVLSPGDLVETETVTKIIMEHKGTCYLRLGRGGEKRIHDEIREYRLGKAIKIHDCKHYDKKVAVFSTGAILDEACNVVELLEADCIGIEQYSFPFVKPIDTEVIKDCIERFDLICSIEEHNIIGGFGSAVAEVISEVKHKSRLIRIGLNDTYCTIVGKQQYLRRQYDIGARNIFEIIREKLAEIYLST